MQGRERSSLVQLENDKPFELPERDVQDREWCGSQSIEK